FERSLAASPGGRGQLRTVLMGARVFNWGTGFVRMPCIRELIRRPEHKAPLSASGKIASLFGTVSSASGTISIVIPVYNEAANLPLLWQRLEPVLTNSGH